jgi:polyphosphate kinase
MDTVFLKPVSPKPVSLKQPDLYVARELSLLEFNRRVLEQAKDARVPLLERLRFLCISSTNLDEFFEVRVAGLKQKMRLGVADAGPDNLSPQEILRELNTRLLGLIAEQYRVLTEIMMPALRRDEIRFLGRADWNKAQAAWLRKYFKDNIQPVLSPLGLDSAHPFPRILNKSLNFVVSLEGKDAFGRNSGRAVISASRSLPQLIQLPANETGGGPYDFVLLATVIQANIGTLFHGMKVDEFSEFRVTRNSELFVDEEEIDDLLRAVEGELLTRHYGDIVRLEVATPCSEGMKKFLQDQFHVSAIDTHQVNGPVNLHCFQDIYDVIDRPDLKYPAFTPALPRALTGSNLFKVIAKKDILLHHPFESFLPVVDFVRQAADDANVLSIKQTLYRTGADSAIVDALVAAAHVGKDVTVVIELRARFDEEANVSLATRLQRAGVHVVYGVVGYKTHAKMVLVVRREGKKLAHYVHLSTGNYHSRTARLYTDYGFLTCNKLVGEDVQRVFNQLTSLGKAEKLKRLLHSPFTLHKALMAKIQREIDHAKKGYPSHIIIKANALTEPRLIQSLYLASQAGVEIDLIIRGMCSLRPGVAGVSERIRVRSIVGRFLEHTRVFYFANGGDEEVFASSADWMERNMFRRVEVCFPFEIKAQRRRIIGDLQLYLKDTAQVWLMKPDGSYERPVLSEGEVPFSAQQTLLDDLAEIT